MATATHWKQHYDPDAPLEFARRMNLGVAGIKFVNPGDPVTDEIRAGLGANPRHRLKIWFRAGYVRLANWTAPDEAQRQRKEAPETKPALETTGRGWYLVHLGGGHSKKVRGYEAAKAALDAAWD